MRISGSAFAGEPRRWAKMKRSAVRTRSRARPFDFRVAAAGRLRGEAMRTADELGTPGSHAILRIKELIRLLHAIRASPGQVIVRPRQSSSSQLQELAWDGPRGCSRAESYRRNHRRPAFDGLSWKTGPAPVARVCSCISGRSPKVKQCLTSRRSATSRSWSRRACEGRPGHPFGPVLASRRSLPACPREAAGARRIAAIRDWIDGEMRGPTTRAAPASPAARRAARRAGGRG